MNWLRNVPIKRKLTLVILATSSAALLLACVAMGAYQMRDFLRTKERDTTVLADVVAKGAQGALTFQDTNDAEQKLLALAAGPGVNAACLYAADGKPFAQYIRRGIKVDFPSQPPPDGTRYESDALVVVRPVTLNDKRIGTILLRSDLQGLYTRLGVLGEIAGGVLLGCCLVAFVLSSWLQRPISQPIVALADAVRNIAERKDYTVRLPERGRDETGLLTDAFNQLLASLGERDTALRMVNDSLSQEVVERKQAEQALARERNLLRMIFDLLPDYIYLKDEQSRFVLCNNRRASDNAVPVTANDLIGKSDADFFPPEQAARFRADELAVLGGKPIIDKEETLVRPDGSQQVILTTKLPFKDSTGKITGLVGYGRDITERTLAETKLRSQLARLELLQQITRAIGERLDLESIFQVVVGTLEDQLPLDFCCVAIYDAAAGTLKLGNIGARSGKFAALLAPGGEQPLAVDESGLGRCVSGGLVYEADIAASQFAFAQRLAQAGLRAFVAAPLLVESKVFGVLLAARSKAESFSSGDCEFLRQLSEHVALAAHQAQLHDALQRAYDDLRQSQQAVMQQERLRALGQMASGIAHDINNAISPIGLYTESLLENEPHLSSRARDNLQTIQHAIEDVAQTVARMREFHRQREPQLTLLPVQLNPLVQQVVNLSRARWSDMPQQRGVVVELVTDLAADLPAIPGVESEIREALLNLVFNAVDAMPDGGTLTLRTRSQHKPGNGENHAVQRAIVEVGDSGIGMDEDTRRRCLEPFFTTKGERGTGLGLAMVYGIAQRHGADIEIDSTMGKGTIMRLIFTAPAVAIHPAAPSLLPLTPQARMRILVIDDDPLLIKSLRDILESDGHIVATANGGQAGIGAFKAALGGNEAFSVVITDLGMPYVDGRKVATAVKTASPSTPVILLTGWGRRLADEGDIPPHVDQLLSKPPKLRELREALAACQQPETH